MRKGQYPPLGAHQISCPAACGGVIDLYCSPWEKYSLYMIFKMQRVFTAKDCSLSLEPQSRGALPARSAAAYSLTSTYLPG